MAAPLLAGRLFDCFQCKQPTEEDDGKFRVPHVDRVDRRTAGKTCTPFLSTRRMILSASSLRDGEQFTVQRNAAENPHRLFKEREVMTNSNCKSGGRFGVRDGVLAGVLLLSLGATCGAGESREIDPTSLPAEAGVIGGVAVHLGCGSGAVIASWGQYQTLIVHGLDTDEGAIRKAKVHVDSFGLYGRILPERYDGRNLPFAEDMVNLILIEDSADVTGEEVERVLVPEGIVYVPSRSGWRPSSRLRRVGEKGRWVKYEKPRSEEIDDWPQFLYGASNNAVSRDRTVGDPHHLQWYAGPEHTRHHDSLASMSAMTSSGGQIFYIYDEGEVSVIHHPPSWKLIARDAYNGVLLWKRDIKSWMTHLYNFRAGPVQLQRRLVSSGDRVFVTLGFSAPVEELDAATGRTLRIYQGSDKAEELVYHDRTLLVVTGNPEMLDEKADGCYGYWEMSEKEVATVGKSIKAYDTITGQKVWEATAPNGTIVPLSLCALGNDVFYLDNERLYCLRAQTGTERWTAAFGTEGSFIRSYAPTVVAHDDVILCLYWNRLCGFSVTDGAKLWEQKGAMGFGSPADLFIMDGKAWTFPQTRSIWRDSKRDKHGVVRTGIPIPKSEFLGGGQKETAVAVDLHTGAIVDSLSYSENQHHHRCHRNRATARYILVGYSGVQLIDPRAKTGTTNQWVRGICQYGFMPANGLLFVPPDPCQCKTEVKVNGFVALAERRVDSVSRNEPVIERGPQFARVAGLLAASTNGGWPTYRGNNERKGSTTEDVKESLVVRWKAKLGPSLSAPTVAAGRALVANRDGCAVHCLDVTTGARIWKHLTDGPVDSPPTVAGGLCVVGSADGSVTCLDLERGEKAWRFRIPEHTRRIGSENRLESPLRIHGAVLVLDEVVYFAAGRSSHLDGGIRLYGLDIRTGAPRFGTRVSSEEGKTSGALDDILVSDGTGITMRQVRFDRDLKVRPGPKGLIARNGFLDGSWFHRTGWTHRGVKGQLIAEGPVGTFTVANPYTGLKKARRQQYREYNQDGHLHIKFTRYKEEHFPIGARIVGYRQERGAKKARKVPAWSITESLQPRAMVLAGETLCVAGWRDFFGIELKSGYPNTPEASRKRESFLRLYSARTGTCLSQHRLDDVPVYDGMAAAAGRLFLSLRNGTLVCLGE